jgi:hypothetical protein
MIVFSNTVWNLPTNATDYALGMKSTNWNCIGITPGGSNTFDLLSVPVAPSVYTVADYGLDYSLTNTCVLWATSSIPWQPATGFGETIQ